MRVRLLFAWYDLWIGAYWDAPRRRLYVLPLPMIGLRIDLPRRPLDPEELLWILGAAFALAAAAGIGFGLALFEPLREQLALWALG